MEVRYKSSGKDVPIEKFHFSDGQPHYKVPVLKDNASTEVVIELAILNGIDILELNTLTEALTSAGYSVRVDIRYLLGARMDRRIDKQQPFTLRVVARMLSDEFNEIRILDPHSDVSLMEFVADAVLPTYVVRRILANYTDPVKDIVIVAPDTGATVRTKRLMRSLSKDPWVIAQGYKKRDIQTGKLTGFGLENPELVKDKHCLIVDDLCDGGGTFSGLSEVLRLHGATRVELFVTHGIFSKGLPIPGIDHVYTTDSWCALYRMTEYLTVYPVDMFYME